MLQGNLAYHDIFDAGPVSLHLRNQHHSSDAWRSVLACTLSRESFATSVLCSFEVSVATLWEEQDMHFENTEAS